MENATIKIDLKQVAAGVGMIFGGVTELLKAMSDENGELVISDSSVSQPETAVPSEGTSAEKEVAQTAEETAVSLVDVRSALARLSKKGLTKEVKELLAKHGGSKLSDVDPGNYAALLAAAKELDPDA